MFGILVAISGQDQDPARVEITVAIPTHNRRETLLLAIESARMQTRPPERILVLADGCTDGTAEAVSDLREPRVEVIELEKGFGVGYGNRNEALRRGGVISWLGDDDLYLPDHLERVGELFEVGDFDLVQAMACVVHEDSTLTALGMDWRVPYFRGLMMKGQNRTPAAAVSHRAEAALEVGGWPDRIRRRGDQDLWQRMLRAGARTAMLAAPTVLHFRATGRVQDYAHRVEQNRGFLERMDDPRELGRLRAEMALATQLIAAREEALRKRLMLGAPHLRARAMLRTRLRELRGDRRKARGQR
jgi:glycosyltransferase involved in cell wall biosynthesis